MSRRDPRVYIHHMLDHASEALEMTQGRSRGDLDTDRTLELSLVRLMEVVGEASRRVPQDLRTQYPDVPWDKTSDSLVHTYDEINFDRLWEIIQDQVPLLIEQLEAILDEQGRLNGLRCLAL